jgi:DNA-binding beta-propeller fold protein YncE
MKLYIWKMNIKPLLILVFVVPVIGKCQPDTGLVWPQPPDTPRIRYVESISSQQAFKSESGGIFSKIAGLFFGEEKEHPPLVQPVGIAVGPDGLIYVADPGAHGVHIFDRARKEYDFLSENKLGKFLSPVGVAVAPDGTIYISDSERGEIVALNKDRDPLFAVRENLVRPTGLAIVREKLYVADPGRQKIVIFTSGGKYLAEFGGHGSGDGEFNYPVAVASAISLFVLDALNYRVQEFDPDAKFLSKFGSQGSAGGYFAAPKSIALDSEGDIYLTDALMDNFQIFNKQGQLLLVVGQRGERIGQFMSPGGITIDANDFIYVIDMLNRRVQIFQYLK